MVAGGIVCETRSSCESFTKHSVPPLPTRPPPAPGVRRIHSIIDLWLGEQLRRRRQALGLPLQPVARACGISVSLLSQLERGLRSISMRTLGALAQELQLPIETLVRNTRYSEGEAEGAVARAGTHRRIDLGDKGIHKENLTPPAASGGVQMYRAVIDPGGSTGDDLFLTHKGEQVGYVIEGQLDLFVQERLLKLKAGDSFCYGGDMPRRWRNPGQTSTTILWAITCSPG
ncbi:XRE family transcriptional regulator [Verminephrobacter eiseniae]|nr:helix-turn-helix domain-containing protein [Verminephrobacter sp. Larva24]MCW5233009.1 XRE family transcriptional regulator [Verminephrobacter eiseniae]MCW5295435.1 XRE family transcriptional regulator [Verminephrobacter eiseniae]MCW8185938.1 XRE family transcriptional regulator [Verminephrobacter eiseniae]MCW8224229.1 XRE family transcriptional regulator [Verminephrobacter eiseniae]